MNKNLQGLRGIFAIFIVLHHSVQWEVAGLCSVSFFFMLSGFTLALGYWDRLDAPSYTWHTFMKKRLWRIYPLHLLCFLAALLLSIVSLDFKQILCDVPNLFLLQSWIPVEPVYFSGNALSWYLSDMLFFYALAPFLIRFVKHCKFFSLWMSLLIWTIAISCLWIFLPDRYVHSIIYISPISRLYEFYIGACAYRIFKNNLEKGRGAIRKIILDSKEIALVLVYALAMYLYYLMPNRYGYTALWIAPNLLVITVFAYHSAKMWGGQFSQILSSKICQLLGKCSFEIYMVHLLCLRYIDIFIHKILHTDNTVVYLAISYIAIILAVVILRRYFNPIINNIRLKYEKTNSI